MSKEISPLTTKYSAVLIPLKPIPLSFAARSTKIIGGVLASIVGYLMIQATYILPILSGSFEGMVYRSIFESDGTLPFMMLLGFVGLVLITVGVIFLATGILSLYRDSVDNTYDRRSRSFSHIHVRGSETDETKSFCPYCGARLTRETIYCTACGKRLS